MKPIIEVKGLSKKYRLGEIQPYYTLRDSLAGVFKNPFAAVKSQLNKDEFWALKDINFEVNQGEVVGIIGRNGAGKSTLLKILSQITPPTEGEVILRGRVGSLLEVGTGFSPELTGRENIYLNGAVLGMKRSEVKKKFDEIVAFSEVEKFLDTPLKHYSSGMYMRLAFAVAAHLEPEILIVDEVLAVGDAEFQKKCLGKMGEVAGEGRTVLFVSHNIGAIQRLTSTSLLLVEGRQIDSGRTSKVIERYTQESNYQNNWKNDGTHFENKELIPLALEIVDKDGDKTSGSLLRGKDYYVKFEFEIKKVDLKLTLGISLFDESGNHLFRSLHTDEDKKYWPEIKPGNNIIRTRLPIEFLNSGNYILVADGGIHKSRWLLNPYDSKVSLNFDIGEIFSSSPYWTNRRDGLVAPKLRWRKYAE